MRPSTVLNFCFRFFDPKLCFYEEASFNCEKTFLYQLAYRPWFERGYAENLVGAYVAVFVGASDHEAAAYRAVSAIRERGFESIDISDGQIHELDPKKWNSFVLDAWPDFVVDFPE